MFLSDRAAVFTAVCHSSVMIQTGVGVGFVLPKNASESTKKETHGMRTLFIILRVAGHKATNPSGHEHDSAATHTRHLFRVVCVAGTKGFNASLDVFGSISMRSRSNICIQAFRKSTCI